MIRTAIACRSPLPEPAGDRHAECKPLRWQPSTEGSLRFAIRIDVKPQGGKSPYGLDPGQALDGLLQVMGA